MKKLFLTLGVLALVVAMACPAYAASEIDAAVTVPASDIMLEFFPSLFESIISIFECAPMLYLFSIFILAFVVLIFRTITRL